MTQAIITPAGLSLCFAALTSLFHANFSPATKKIFFKKKLLQKI